MIGQDDVTKVLDQVLQVVIADDPRRPAQRALDYLRGSTGAQAAAVLIPPTAAKGLEVFVSSPLLDHDAMDRAQSVWQAERTALVEGRWQHRSAGEQGNRHHLLVPLLHSQSLVALLYMDFANPRFFEHLDKEGIARFGRIFAASVISAEASTDGQDLRAHLTRKSARELRRAQLLAQLDDNEWNVAMTARRMGVARVTIYAWMRAFNIPRRRVLKTARRSL